jgi:hypothetical protein
VKVHELNTTEEKSLSERHRKMLEAESRISPEVIEARGYWTAETIEELAEDPAIKSNQYYAPALVLPIFGVDGKHHYSRVRPDTPPLAPLGKYLQPADTPNVLDIPRTVLGKVLDPAVKVLAVTEGEKKADYLASLGVPVICLFGVWNWSHKTGRDTPYESQLLLPDFDRVPLRDKKVSILFDCDTATNGNIQLAAYRLAQKLRERGAVLW